MKTLHGIVTSEDGLYVMVTMRRSSSGWRFSRSRRWRSSPLANELLAGRGVTVGLPDHWQSATGELNRGFAAAPGAGSFTCVTHTASLATEARPLCRNVLASVPRHAYLCTLPLLAGAAPENSFVAVQRRLLGYSIGVVLSRKLVAVFELAPAEPASLAGHLERVRRFLQRRMPGAVLPATLYCIDTEDVGLVEHFAVHHLSSATFGIPRDDESPLLAAGVALCGLESCVPVFDVPAESQSRLMRGVLYGATAAVLGLTLAAVVTVGVATAVVGTRLASRRHAYAALVAGNPELQRLAEENGRLAAQICRLEGTLLRQTRWTELLEMVGRERPAGLRFEQLGSESHPTSVNLMRIALAGWAERESDVTSFISKIQKDPVLSDVTLASLERSEGMHSTVRFRILCTLKLYDM